MEVCWLHAVVLLVADLGLVRREPVRRRCGPVERRIVVVFGGMSRRVGRILEPARLGCRAVRRRGRRVLQPPGRLLRVGGWCVLEPPGRWLLHGVGRRRQTRCDSCGSARARLLLLGGVLCWCWCNSSAGSHCRGCPDGCPAAVAKAASGGTNSSVEQSPQPCVLIDCALQQSQRQRCCSFGSYLGCSSPTNCASAKRAKLQQSSGPSLHASVWIPGRPQSCKPCACFCWRQNGFSLPNKRACSIAGFLAV